MHLSIAILTLTWPPHFGDFRGIFSVKVKIIVNQYHWKEKYLSLIQKQTYASANHIQINERRLMAKIEYLIVPEGSKFTELGKLGFEKGILMLSFLNNYVSVGQ